MDEGIIMRALTIGASVFVALATVTLVLMYYNTAKTGASNIGRGTDIETSYRNDIEYSLAKPTITGVELKNLLNYFYKNPDVQINLVKFKLLKSDGSLGTYSNYDNINNFDSSRETDYNNVMKNIIPNQILSLTKNNNKYTVTLLE